MNCRPKLDRLQHVLRLLFAGVLSALCVPQAAAQPDATYTQRQWTTEDGLLVNTVRDLEQGPQGYLWMATYAGLVRFDGVEFSTMAAATSDLPTNRLQTLQTGPEGDLWLRTAGEQMIQVDPRRRAVVGTYGQGAGGIPEPVYALAQTDSTLWLRTYQMLYAARRDGAPSDSVWWQSVLPDSMNVIAAQGGADGTLWVGTSQRGLWRVRHGTAEPVAARSADGQRVESINEIAIRGDRVWVANDDRLFRLEGDRFVALPSAAQILTGPPLGLKATANRLWVYRGSGIHVIENGRARRVSDGPVGAQTVRTGPEGRRWTSFAGEVRRDGRPVLETDGTIERLYRDREGNWWVATERDGLYRLRRTPITMVDADDGLPATNVYGVSPTRPDSSGIWVGSIGGGLTRVRGGAVESVTEPWDLPSIVWTAHEAQDGTVWIGTQEGLYVHEPRPSTTAAGQEGVPEALRHLPLRAAYQDREGRVWFYQHGTLCARTDGQWHTRAVRPDSRATGRAMTQTENGSVWIGTDGEGLYRIRGDSLASARVGRVTTADGLPSDRIRSLHEGGDGFLWVGTGDTGLARLDRRGTLSLADDSISAITRADGLPGNTISQILPDGRGRSPETTSSLRSGRLWMSTNRGIFRVSRAELNAFVNGETERVHPVVYTEEDGLNSREANGGVHPAGTRTADGRLWVPTQEGVTAIDPERARDVPPPPAAIERVTSMDTTYTVVPRDTLYLPPAQRTFTIHYAGLYFAEPAATRYRARLHGFERRPTRTGQRSVRYTEVDPGTYQFVVRAAGERGAWGEPTRLVVTVAPFWWETRWFYGLCGLGLLGFILGAYRWRTYRLRRRQERLEQTVAERTEQLEKQAERLQELDEAKSRFFANVSHEFRTPLTLIRGPVRDVREHLQRGTLQNVPADADEDAEQLHLVERNTARLQRLIDQILGLARLDAGTYELAARPTDLSDEVRRIVRRFEPMAERTGLALSVDVERPVDDDAPPVYVDPEAFEHVLSNLLSNAVKFTPEGGTVTVSVTRTGEHAAVAVADTGRGIPEEEQDAIFDRFEQSRQASSAAREEEGTGIGLAFARDLVDLHGGTLELDSTEGEGSTFTVTLPRGPDHLSEEQLTAARPNEDRTPTDAEDVETTPAPLSSPSSSNPAPEEPTSSDLDDAPGAHSPLERRNSKLVLVVDDNADVRRYVRSVLEPEYAVIEASDGEEGLETAREALPDVILADVMMPGADGHEMTRRLKDDPETEAIPVVMLTARAETTDEVEGLQAGADDYVTKPFDADVLRQRIGGVITMQERLRRRLEAQLDDRGAPDDGPDATERPEIEWEARRIIRTHLSDPDFGVADLANELGMGRSTLYRRFDAQVGESPADLITAVRLEEAAELLQQEEGTVTQVAYAVGYERLSNFSNQFTERTGTRPSALVG